MGFRERIGQLCAAILLTCIVSVQCGGVVTNMTAEPAEAQASATITLRCTVQVTGSSSLQPTVHLHKKFANQTWNMFINDEADGALDPEVIDPIERNRFQVELKIANNVITATYTIFYAENADTGNYSCHVGNLLNTTKYAYVNVLAEATNVSMYLGNERISLSNAGTTMERKYVQLNGKYRLNCTVGGGNPYPEVTLASDSGSIPGPTVATKTYQRGSEFLSTVLRDTTVTVPEWTADISYIGKPLRCSGGIANTKVLSVGFIPITNQTVPIFNCNDSVYVGKMQTDLVHSCLVYSYPSNISTLYIHWHYDNDNMMNITTSAATLRPGRNEFKLQSDGHYQLLVDSPTTSTDHWWKMTLKIEGVHTRPNNLNNINFDFVANNTFATAKHVVKAYVDAVGGTSGGVKLSASGLFVLVAAFLLTVSRQ